MASPNIDIKRKTLDLVLDLITPRETSTASLSMLKDGGDQVSS